MQVELEMLYDIGRVQSELLMKMRNENFFDKYSVLRLKGFVDLYLELEIKKELLYSLLKRVE